MLSCVIADHNSAIPRLLRSAGDEIARIGPGRVLDVVFREDIAEERAVVTIYFARK